MEDQRRYTLHTPLPQQLLINIFSLLACLFEMSWILDGHIHIKRWLVHLVFIHSSPLAIAGHKSIRRKSLLTSFGLCPRTDNKPFDVHCHCIVENTRIASPSAHILYESHQVWNQQARISSGLSGLLTFHFFYLDVYGCWQTSKVVHREQFFSSREETSSSRNCQCCARKTFGLAANSAAKILIVYQYGKSTSVTIWMNLHQRYQFSLALQYVAVNALLHSIELTKAAAIYGIPLLSLQNLNGTSWLDATHSQSLMYSFRILRPSCNN